jgi:hypothetical protein
MKTKETTHEPGQTGAADAARGLLKRKRAQRQKGPSGSTQGLEKARFGEENPRIFFALIWLGFAG